MHFAKKRLFKKWQNHIIGHFLSAKSLFRRTNTLFVRVLLVRDGEKVVTFASPHCRIYRRSHIFSFICLAKRTISRLPIYSHKFFFDFSMFEAYVSVSVDPRMWGEWRSKYLQKKSPIMAAKFTRAAAATIAVSAGNNGSF